MKKNKQTGNKNSNKVKGLIGFFLVVVIAIFIADEVYLSNNQPVIEYSSTNYGLSYRRHSSSTSHSSYSNSSSGSNSSSSSSSKHYSSSSSHSNSNKSYDEGYDDVDMDDDYDYYRYDHDNDYADGVDDAMDELDEEW